MKRMRVFLCFLLALGLLAGCGGGAASPAPTPMPDPIADVDPESGTLGALAFAIAQAMGVAVSAGDLANDPATGIGAAKLAVTALGLDLELRMQSAGRPATDEDYLALALRHEIAPGALFTAEGMSAAQIAAFAELVAEAAQRGIGFDSDARAWTPAQLPADAETVLRMAVLAYNPLAEGRGLFRYGVDMGNRSAIAYWSLAALEGAKIDRKDALAFIALDDQTNKSWGTTSVDAAEYANIYRESWGLALPSSVPGLAEANGRLYLGAPEGDTVRQFPTAYRVERSGDLLRVHANVLNRVHPPQYAGKVVAILRESPETALGWQIASLEACQDELPVLYSVDAPATAQGYSALSLIDGDPQTVWQIGNADADTARIQFGFQQPTAFSGIAIYNGDHSGGDAALKRSKRAEIVGIRFSPDAQQDDMRVDLSMTQAQLKAGREIVIPFSEEIVSDTIVLVFYGQSGGHIRLSGVRVL